MEPDREKQRESNIEQTLAKLNSDVCLAVGMAVSWSSEANTDAKLDRASQIVDMIMSSVIREMKSIGAL